MRTLWLLMLLLFLPAHGEPERHLKVGLIGSPPFVIYQDGKPSGIDVRLWDDIAARLKFKYEFHRMETVDQAIEALHKRELDIVVGGVIITADRERLVNFTQPYYRTGSAIISANRQSAWDRLRPLVRKAAIYGGIGLCGSLVLVGTLLWLAERRVNHLQFSSSPPHGIATGIWLALVTMSTVGYGDRVPVTLPGRLIAGAWMLISMLFVSSLVAGIASSITVSQIGTERLEKPTQLNGLRIASVRGTYYDELVRHFTTRIVERDNLDSAISAVLENEADCVVYDLPALTYFMAQFPQLPLHLSEVPFEAQNFGWAMRDGLPESDEINVAMLAEVESGRFAIIEREFLKEH